MTFSTTLKLVIAAASLAATTPAIAQDAASAPASSPMAIDAHEAEWRFSFTPNLWAVSLSGEAEVRGIVTDVGASFLDTLSDSDSLIGLMGRLEVGHGKWTVFIDGAFVQVGVDDVPTPLAEADFVSTLQWWEIGGAWRLCDKPASASGDPSRRFIAEILGGVRITSLDLEVDFSAIGDRQQDKVWADPFIGGRILYDISKNWSTTFRGDIGGFGVGCDFSWQVIATFGYNFDLFSCSAYAFAGYRALSQDYHDGNFGWDVIAHGPMLGLSIRF